MRNYGSVRPRYWNGTTGRALKAAGVEAQLVGAYLMTSPHANMLGLYYLPLSYMEGDLAGDPEALRKGLARACDLGFCRYDFDAEWVWVVTMCRQQLAPDDKPIKPSDNRAKSARALFYKLDKNPWLNEFRAAYRQELGLENPHPKESDEALGKGLASPSEGLGGKQGYQRTVSSEQGSEKDPPVVPPAGGRSRREPPEGFNAFWSVYPKRVGKGAAEKAWLKARPPIDAVLATLAWQRVSEQWTRDGGQYVPNPATYLNQRRWEDEPPAALNAVPNHLRGLAQVLAEDAMSGGSSD